MSERCEWSDLRVEHCAHCGAAPGSSIILSASVAVRPTLASEPDGPTLARPSLPDTWAPSADDGECRCGKPTRNSAWICDGCQGAFSSLLGELPALDDEIGVTLTKQRAAAIASGSRATATALPWHERAGDARRALHGLLVSWVRFCAEEDVRGPQIEDPSDNIPSLADWLATRVHGLALHDIGPEAFDEITDAAAECHRIVFWKRRSRVYLGTCGVVSDEPDEDGIVHVDPCPGEVYAEEGDAVGACDYCGSGVTVVIRKSEIEKRLDDRLCTPAEIATYAVHLGLDAPRERVRKRINYWSRHKLIEERGTNEKGEPMFSYGSVRRLLYKEFADKAS